LTNYPGILRGLPLFFRGISGCCLDFLAGVAQVLSLSGIHNIPNMKIRLLSVLCFGSLLLTGCTSSSSQTCKSPSSAAATKSSVYDPATDTTTIKNGGDTWFLKGNHTNMMLEPRP
jgi:hypothetical protein